MTQEQLPGMESDFASSETANKDVVDALRAENERRLLRIQQTTGQTMDPTGIVIMTLIDHCFDEESRIQFLFDLETRISESLDEFESRNTLLVAQPTMPGGVNNLF